MDLQGPLAGVRVVECVGWNGVLAGRLLADAGADVVRVVPPSGDPLDSEPPFFGDSRVSIQSTWYNAGKRLASIDLGTAAGRGHLLGLVAAADILIEDWPPARPPLTAQELRASNPALAHVSVTPMGLDGPLSGLRVNDLVANALCGAASVTGAPETPPLSGYGNQTYHTVGLYAAICALAARRAARATGRYQHVDLSAHEALVSCTEQVLMQWFFPEGAWKSPIAPRLGSLHWSRAYEVYPAETGGGVMVTAALHFVDVLLPWLKEEGAAQELANPERYPNFLSMVQDLPYVMNVLREWVTTHDADELFLEAQRRHQPFGPVWNIPKVLESPQIAARGYLAPRDVPGFGAVRFPGRFFTTDADGTHPSPATKATLSTINWEPREARRPDGGSATSTVPLAGVRVLDLTHVLAGPFGTRVLGDLGADVIKVATATRSGGANSPEHPYYVCWNRNKRSITLDMATGEGRGVAHRLAGSCDAIIENFSPGVLKRWGLDREAMAADNPGLSIVAMGGMGQTGPWRDFVTFAPTIHAVVGLTYLTNFPGTTDLGYGFSLTDHLSGLAGALAVLEGLEHRERTGRGLDVDLAQYELGLGLMGPALLDYLANGVDPRPVGNRHPFDRWAPHGIYRCAGDDRWVAIAVRGDLQWGALAALMGQPALATDPRFATHDSRIQHQDALDAAVEAWTSARDRYEVMSACQGAGLAAGAVQDARDLVERDSQLARPRFFGTARSERWGEYGIDRFPALFTGARPAACEGVHTVGQDTFDVLTTILGLSPDEIATLAATGALT